MILRNAEGGARIVDCQSTHGTFVNGRRVYVARLYDGAMIRLGTNIMISFHHEYPSLHMSAPDGPRRYGAVWRDAEESVLLKSRRYER